MGASMTETFAPIKPPGFPTSETTDYRVRKAEFGDGYVQVAKDGINSSTVKYELTWPVLSLADAATIKAFFDARGGYEYFYYTVPGDIERAYRNGPVVKAYQDSGVTCSLTVTLTEVHLP